MNRRRRSKIAKLANSYEALRTKLKLLHDEELGYREHLWSRGIDESDTADISDDAIDALNRAETLAMELAMELRKAYRKPV